MYGHLQHGEHIQREVGGCRTTGVWWLDQGTMSRALGDIHPHHAAWLPGTPGAAW